jgi:hypothetical protein
VKIATRAEGHSWFGLAGRHPIRAARPDAQPPMRHQSIYIERLSDADAVIRHSVDISENPQEFEGNLKAENFP